MAALPENIRQEVIADHLRMQRIQQRTREQQNAETPGGMEVNPEFLAALPPAIQEEVRSCPFPERFSKGIRNISPRI